MRYLALAEALELHHRLIETSGGTHGLRDLGLLESALAQPRLTFDGGELYSDVIAKAGALAFSLIQNHVFLDGNKRIGHAAMETFLMLTATGAGQNVLGRAGRRCTRSQRTWPSLTLAGSEPDRDKRIAHARPPWAQVATNR